MSVDPGDPRSRRVAVVADSLLESLLPKLRADHYGSIQLPPADLEPEVTAAWLDQVAEHVAEFLRHDYEVVLAGDGTNEALLTEKLAELGVEPLPRAGF
ncbi:MAG TPA: hypothetical protein VH416_04855 [Gaiellaceae bacterium]|jgi:RecA-family ATPase